MSGPSRREVFEESLGGFKDEVVFARAADFFEFFPGGAEVAVAQGDLSLGPKSDGVSRRGFENSLRDFRGLRVFPRFKKPEAFETQGFYAVKRNSLWRVEVLDG